MRAIDFILSCFVFTVNQLAYHRLTLLCNKLDVDDVVVSII